MGDDSLGFSSHGGCWCGIGSMPYRGDAMSGELRLFDSAAVTTPYVIERRGTSSAPWCVVHRASGLTLSVERPYPGAEALPPIQVGNHRTPQDAEAAAAEVDWELVAERAATPEWQAVAAKAADKRAFDAEYQAALQRARDAGGPWPWGRAGLLHSPVCRVAPTLGRTDPPACPVCGTPRPAAVPLEVAA